MEEVLFEVLDEVLEADWNDVDEAELERWIERLREAYPYDLPNLADYAAAKALREIIDEAEDIRGERFPWDLKDSLFSRMVEAHRAAVDEVFELNRHACAVLAMSTDVETTMRFLGSR